jgi:hypothetical protein
MVSRTTNLVKNIELMLISSIFYRKQLLFIFFQVYFIIYILIATIRIYLMGVVKLS